MNSELRGRDSGKKIFTFRKGSLSSMFFFPTARELSIKFYILFYQLAVNQDDLIRSQIRD